jgi:DNA replication protein DnaC
MQDLTPEERLGRLRLEESIAKGQEPCFHCGLDTPSRCPVCSTPRAYWHHWRHVDKRFKDADLRLLQPREDLAHLFHPDRQREAIALLKSNPTGSYCLAGTPGAGKTHYLYCLYRQALRHTAANYNYMTMPVWLTSASELVSAASARKADSSLPTPKVTPELVHRVARQDLRPCLFLDEVDKFPATESKLEFLGSLINAVYSANGQIVATTNVEPDALIDRWDAVIPHSGTAIVRRFALEPEGTSINFTYEPKRS